jgi:hypothetical protein
MSAGGVREGAGRKAGSLGENAVALKSMVTEALDKSGGVAYLVRQAEENPVAFLSLIGKMIPRPIDRESITGVDPAIMLAELKARAILADEKCAAEEALDNA